MTNQIIAQEALSHALQSQSMSNYAAIYSGFAEKGITDIKPRENVFTFNAWKALGRSVRKGEHGVKVCTWVPMSKKDADGVAQPIGRKPRMTTVFHISQTDPIDSESDSDADTGTHADVETDEKPATAESQGFKVEGFINTASEYYSDEFTPV